MMSTSNKAGGRGGGGRRGAATGRGTGARGTCASALVSYRSSSGARETTTNGNLYFLCIKDRNPREENGHPKHLFKWFCISPDHVTSVPSSEPTQLEQALPEMSPEFNRTDFGCCALGSNIYVLGGYRVEEWEKENEWKGETDRSFMKYTVFNEVLVCDTESPESGWKTTSRMNSPRAYPELAVVDQQIYIIGTNMNSLFPHVNPWGEVFNPHTEKWTLLQDPPGLRQQDYMFRSALVDHHKILVNNVIPGINYSYNTKTLKWEHDKTWPLLWQCDSYLLSHDDGLVYAFYNCDFSVCKFDHHGKPTYEKIPGLEKYLERMKLEPTEPPVYPFHLGNRQFCLVWGIGKRHPDFTFDNNLYNQLIHCLFFHLSDSPHGGQHAVVDRCNLYLAPGLEIVACVDLGNAGWESGRGRKNGGYNGRRTNMRQDGRYDTKGPAPWRGM